MCGINAIWKPQSTNGIENTIRSMNAAIAHRGPDADGVWFNDLIALGHRRLSILDTSPAGHQPFFSEDRKLVMVFNGEVYNYLELKQELSTKYTFHTGTDTEVLLAAYKEWGIEAIHRFIGMFAFVLWDNDAQKAFVVRDRMGIKPIYIARTEKGTLFSSEIRAVLKSDWVNKKLSKSGLHDYLRYQTVHAPNTIIEGVTMLMPGHYLELSSQGERLVHYWKMEDAPVNELPRKQLLSTIEDILLSSVQLRMRADVPFGAFLSGGIDSSIIVGLMSKVASKQVNTFAITFHEKQWDESPYSQLIARRFNTAHHEIRVHAEHFLETIPEALNAMDHPSGDGPNTYVVSGATRKAGVKMALSGLGGDELFAGYDVFKRMKELENKAWLNSTPQAIRSLAGSALLKLKPSLAAEKIKATLSQPSLDVAHAYPLVRQILMDKKISSLLHGEALSPNVVAQLAAIVGQQHLPLLSKVSVLEMQTYMQNVLLRDTDQMSMAHALEVRVPFLDHRLVHLILGVNDEMKYPHSPKQLLTDAVGDLIPREIIDRPKMGFTFPWAKWMKEDLKSFCEEQLAYLKGLKAFDERALELMWNGFLNNDPMVSWSRIWPLVVLGFWLKKQEVSD